MVDLLSRPTIRATRTPVAIFLVRRWNMSWQLAIVVLVPILGGVKLDDVLDMSPLLTLVGFFIAMAGTGAVVWRQLQLLSPAPKEHKS